MLLSQVEANVARMVDLIIPRSRVRVPPAPHVLSWDYVLRGDPLEMPGTSSCSSGCAAGRVLPPPRRPRGRPDVAEVADPMGWHTTGAADRIIGGPVGRY